MTLIIGGAYQGKTAFVRERFSQSEIVDGEVCSPNEAFTAHAISHFERLVKRIIPHSSAVEYAEELCKRNPDIIIIADEIGSGIIPLDREERLWREETGKALCVLAKFSDTVIRIACGIPVVIKGEQYE